MAKKKILTEEDLEKTTGGVRPEEIGDPVMLPNGVASYEVCEDCGACMFPKYKRFVNGTEVKLQRPDYVCSECGKEHHVMQIFA